MTHATCPVCSHRCCVENYAATIIVTCEARECPLSGRTGVGRSIFEAREHLKQRARDYGFSIAAANDAGALSRAAGG